MPQTRPPLLTLVAIAFLAFAIADLSHEALGHGGACVLVGSKILQVTTGHLSCDDGSASRWAERFVSAGGTLINFIELALFIVLARLFRRGSANTRYFLWLAAMFNGLSGAGYMMTSPIFGFGDWEAFVNGLTPSWPWRIGISAIGIVSGLLVAWYGAGTIPSFATDAASRGKRILFLCAVPWLAAGCLCMAGTLINGADSIVMAIAASFLGDCWLVFVVPSMAVKRPAGDPLQLTLSVPWLSAGAFAAVNFLFVFAPGVPR